MSKVILFYKYVHIEHPEAIRKEQLALCTKLQLTGRVILAHEGINATLGGSDEAISTYREYLDNHPLFVDIDVKESLGGAESFPRLSIKVKNEIVHLGLDTTIYTAKDGGVHLEPQQVHQLLQERPEDLVILDARNNYESAIGRFVDQITPDIQHFRQFPQFVDENLDLFKNKKVLMHCTGGIRCERASTYLKSKGVATEIYQIQGGIHRYIEQFPDGYFRGKNYVFDNRVAVKANDDILGTCYLCNKPCDEYTNCLNAVCNKHFICCSDCKPAYANTCSSTCKHLIETNQVKKRPLFVSSNSMANRS